jgi:hypothetical protein
VVDWKRIAQTKADSKKSRKDFYAADFQAQWVAQLQPRVIEGANDDGDEYFDVPVCTTVDFWAVLKNTGSTPWVASTHDEATDGNEFTFATYKDPRVKSAPQALGYDDCPDGPHCGKSYFRHASWVSDYRIGTLEQSVVYPGESGKVRMTFQVPCDATPGRYREDISAASGKYWIYNPANGDPLDVMHLWVGFDVTD